MALPIKAISLTVFVVILLTLPVSGTTDEHGESWQPPRLPLVDLEPDRRSHYLLQLGTSDDCYGAMRQWKMAHFEYTTEDVDAVQAILTYDHDPGLYNDASARLKQLRKQERDTLRAAIEHCQPSHDQEEFERMIWEIRIGLY